MTSVAIPVGGASPAASEEAAVEPAAVESEHEPGIAKAPIDLLDLFPAMEFDVVKRHHNHGWYRQRRVLILSGDSVCNARPRTRADTAPSVTKSHSLRKVIFIAMKSKRSFMLRFDGGDHDYFYSSAHAMEIVWEINRRRGALRAVEQLSSRGEGAAKQQRLMHMFVKGFLHVPRTDWTENTAVERKVELIRAIRAGAVDGGRDMSRIRERYASVPPSEMDITEFRRELNDVRQLLVQQLMTRQRSLSATLTSKLSQKDLPTCYDEAEAAACSEEAIQVIAVTALHSALWTAFELQPGNVRKQQAFERNRKALASKPLEHFGVKKGLEDFNPSLAADHLAGLLRSRNPCDMMNVITIAAKSIQLSLEASRHLLDSETDLAAALSADDLLPLVVLVLAKGAAAAESIPYQMVRLWIEAIGDPTECTERAYYFTMFASAVEYIAAGDPEDGGEWRVEDESTVGADEPSFQHLWEGSGSPLYDPDRPAYEPSPNSRSVSPRPPPDDEFEESLSELMSTIRSRRSASPH